jgi:hypothetical protein
MAKIDRSHQYHATPAICHPSGLALIAAAGNWLFAAVGDVFRTLAAVTDLKGATFKDGYVIGEVSMTGNGSIAPVDEFTAPPSPSAGVDLDVEEADQDCLRALLAEEPSVF